MYPLCTVLSNVSRVHQKNLRTVNLMKYNSHLINVEHRSNTPHQKWLLKYLQLPAVQNPFYIDKKHVKFNLSHVFFCHISFSCNVLKSYQNPLTVIPDWHHIGKREWYKWYVSSYNSYTDLQLHRKGLHFKSYMDYFIDLKHLSFLEGWSKLFLFFLGPPARDKTNKWFLNTY